MGDEETLALSDFLRTKANFRSILEPDLAAFLNVHMNELLALLNSDGEDSRLAFVMLSNLPTLLAKQMENDDSIYIALSEMLGTETASPLGVSRIATVLENLAARCPNDTARMIGYLPVLLNYIQETSVLEFFARVTSDRPKFAAFHTCLACIDVGGIVDSALHSSPSSDRAVNLMRLISLCCRTRVTRACFANSRVIATLAEFCAVEDLRVQGRCWEAVAALCCAETAPLLAVLCARAVDVAKESRDAGVGLCAVWDFITKMVSIEDAFAEHVMETGVCEVALRHMIVHGGCANLMGSVFRFVRTGMNGCLMSHMIQHVMPFIVESARTKRVDAVCANSRKVLADIFAKHLENGPMLNWINREIGLVKLKHELIDPYVFALASPYGGFHANSSGVSLPMLNGPLVSLMIDRLVKKSETFDDS